MSDGQYVPSAGDGMLDGLTDGLSDRLGGVGVSDRLGDVGLSDRLGGVGMLDGLEGVGLSDRLGGVGMLDGLTDGLGVGDPSDLLDLLGPLNINMQQRQHTKTIRPIIIAVLSDFLDTLAALLSIYIL